MAGDQPVPRHAPQRRRHRRLLDAHPTQELALRERRILPEVLQHQELRRGEPERTEALGRRRGTRRAACAKPLDVR